MTFRRPIPNATPASATARESHPVYARKQRTNTYPSAMRKAHRQAQWLSFLRAAHGSVPRPSLTSAWTILLIQTNQPNQSLCFVIIGFRSYNPDVGRWLNRDPSDEHGGCNLLAFRGNDLIGSTDDLGLSIIFKRVENSSSKNNRKNCATQYNKLNFGTADPQMQQQNASGQTTAYALCICCPAR